MPELWVIYNKSSGEEGMTRFIFTLILTLVVGFATGVSAYNFQPGPFPYPYPNTLDDYPNTWYCNNGMNYWYPTYRVEGIMSPYTQPNGCVTYYWSYSKTTSLGQPISKVKRSGIFPRVRATVSQVKVERTNDNNIDMPIVPNHRHMTPREYKYKWGKPF